MREFFLMALVNGVAIFLTATVLPGVYSEAGWGGLVIVAVVFGIANAFIKPVIKLLAAPALVLTLGFAMFVINACLLQLTALVWPGFVVENILWAAIGGVVMGIWGGVLERILERYRHRRGQQRRARRRERIPRSGGRL